MRNFAIIEATFYTTTFVDDRMPAVMDMFDNVRNLFIAIAIILVSSNSIIAQRNSPIVVSGTVTEVKVEGQLLSFLIDPKNEWAGRRWERKDPYFNVMLGLQFCNQSEARLIVPYRSVFSSQKLLFRDLPSFDSKVTASIDGKKFSATADDEKWLQKELEKPEPSIHYFAQIEPGTCFEHTVRIPVDGGFRIETRPSNRKSEPDIAFAVPNHPYFTIQFSRTMNDTLPVVEAKARWRKFGRLLTTSNDNFFLETELIINKLPDVLPEKPQRP